MGENGSSTRPHNVLFLCTGNAARSILAEAILNRVGAPRFKAYSAGSQPKGQVDPRALALLDGRGFPTDGLRSKSWHEFRAPGAPELDFVITVCDKAAREACPVWPGRPARAHWSVPDPAAAGGSQTALAEAFELLHSHITAFCAPPLAGGVRP